MSTVTLADAVAELRAQPRPLLCLDTCVLLDIITTGNRGQSDQIEVNRKLLQVIATTPERVQVVITSLVLLEWNQRRDDVRNEAKDWLSKLDKQIVEVHRAWERLGNPLRWQAPTYGDLDLVDRLTELAESVLQSATVLDEDGGCVTEALSRVKQKKRPSHNKQIKDSLHLEHYLKLSRQLHEAGFAESCLFVSTNSSDFWADKNNPREPHLDLVDNFAAAHLKFRGRLPLALVDLGIIGSSASSGP